LATNKYFTSFKNNTNEQDLMSSLNREAIQIYGQDVYYIPRTLVNEDKIFGEDTLSAFEKYYTIEMYISSFDGFGEGTDLLSKFGLSIRDECRFEVERVRFTEETEIDIPLEGDLIYLPLAKALFEIKFVEDEEAFYQLGNVPTWKIKTVLFSYSSEDFDTGLEEIDNITGLDTSDGGEDMYGDGDVMQTEGDIIRDDSETDPFGGY